MRRFATDPYTLALYHLDEGQGDVLKDSSDTQASWSTPQQLDYPQSEVGYASGPSLLSDGTLLFHGWHRDGQGQFDLWTIRRVPVARQPTP